MEQKLVQRCETEVIADACNASYIFYTVYWTLYLAQADNITVDNKRWRHITPAHPNGSYNYTLYVLSMSTLLCLVNCISYTICTVYTVCTMYTVYSVCCM